MNPQQLRRAPWLEANLQRALAAINDGIMSRRRAVTKYCISRRMLRNHLVTGSQERRLGRKSILTSEQETELVERVIRYSNIGMPLTPRMLRRQVYRFFVANNLRQVMERTCKQVVVKTFSAQASRVKFTEDPVNEPWKSSKT